MEKHTYRSVFWPLILIGVGVIWLLTVMGAIPTANLSALLSLWPVVLIIAGLHMLIGRRSVIVSALLALFSLALIVVVLIAGPALGLPETSTLHNRVLTDQFNGATSASVDLDLSSQPVYIGPAASADNLFEADLDYYGTLSYSASGSPHRFIKLDSAVNGISLNFDLDPSADWKIGLTPSIPLDLRVNAGSGAGEIDLSELNLETFRFESGSGAFSINLPPSAKAYEADFDSGSGSLDIDLPAQTNLTVKVNAGSGSVNMTLPDNAEVRVEIRDAGSGSVSLPERLERSSGTDKEGIWETSGYQTANARILIICQDLGSGAFSLH